MKYYIFSDFYADETNFNFERLPYKVEDNCIIAGNMCKFENYDKFNNFIHEFSKRFLNVFIVCGLYEYDSKILDIQDCSNLCKFFESCYENIKFLNDTYIIVNDTLIYGSTLWKNNSKLNNKSKFFLQDALSASIIKNKKIIVITNVPPSLTYCFNEHESKYNVYNNLDYYFKYSNLFDFWIYGCSQENKNILINDINLISNQYIVKKDILNIDIFIEI